MTDPIVCPGCDKIRPTKAEVMAGPKSWHAAEARYGPCCNVLCTGRWGAGCMHCHHPSYAVDTMRAAVDRWAASHGRLSLQHDHDRPAPWTCDPLVAGALPKIWDVDRKQHDVDPQTLFVWALVFAVRLDPIDVGRCQWCDGSGIKREKIADLTPSEIDRLTELSERYPDLPVVQALELEVLAASYLCLGCKGARRDVRDPAMLVLDAIPRTMRPLDPYGRRPVIGGIEQPDPVARYHLAVLADRLQGEAHVVGTQIALWLAGKVGSVAPAIAWLDEQRNAGGSV